MKQKMTAMDVRALVILLRSKIVGLRVANVYDVSGRLYLLKMSKGGCKETLLIESGIRIHTTEFIKNNKTLPSGFSMKLRKHLRTRKCTSIRQLGMDRVIDIQFGKDEFASHIIIELYAQGNIILTDDKYTILSLLRSYTLDGPPTQDENGEGPARCAVKEKYPFSAAANLTEDNIITDPESIKKIIDDQFKSKESKEPEKTEAPTVDSKKQLDDKSKIGNQQKKGEYQKTKKTPKQTEKTQKAMSLKQVIQKTVPYSSAVYAEHIFRQMGIPGNTKALSQPEEEGSPNHIDILIEAAKKLRDLVKEMESADEIQGYIIYSEESEEERKRKEEEDAKLRELIKQNQGADTEQILEQDDNDEEFLSAKNAEIIKKFKGKMLKEFVPHFLLKQYDESEDKNMLYESFDACVDEYFSQAEKQKEVSKNQSKESAIWSKMNKIKQDQEKRISGLQKEQDLSEFKALLLQKHILDVQAIIDILQVMTNSGISWGEITRQVKEERKGNNPLANLIYSMNLDKGQISVILDAVNEDEEQDQMFQIDDQYLTNFDPVMKVDIDLNISAQLNIRKYFEIKKKSYEKEKKTKDAAVVAIQMAEKTAMRDLEKHKIAIMKDSNKNRKVFWFEKFSWFVTSENYLVIGGKDAQQNEMLVKKYMDKGDLFFHCELHGAAVCILKNPSGGIVPPMSIEECACFEVCHSPSWTNNVLSQVYWVNFEQVSKTPPSGMYIATGSFIIRGKRNFVQPRGLQLGLTIMFALNEESLANHIGERKSRLDPKDTERLEKEKREQLEKEAMEAEQNAESEIDSMKDIQVVQLGQVKPVKKWHMNKDGEVFDTQSQMSKMSKAQSQFNKSVSGFSMSQFGTNQSQAPGSIGGVGGSKVTFLNNSQQNHQEQLSNYNAYKEAKLSKQQIQQQLIKEKKLADQAAKQKDKPVQEQQAVIPRGKHKKIKKMKEKYGDQDEDERAMRLTLLGAKDVQGFDIQKHAEKKLAKFSEIKELGSDDDESDSDEEDSDEDQDEEKQDQDSKSPDQDNEEEKKEDIPELDEDLDEGFFKDQKEDIDPDAIIEENEEAYEEDENESQDIQQILKEEDIKFVPEDQDISEIDKLTGNPSRKDTLMFGIPMLAPYSTIQSYKYKVKITPGTQKRGRVQKTIKDLFVKIAKESKIETQQVKSIPDQDMTMVLVNNCKVAAAGLTAIQQAKKKEKKAQPKPNKEANKAN